MLSLFLNCIFSISLRFIDRDGFDIPDVSAYNEFTLMLDNPSVDTYCEFKCTNTILNTANRALFEFIENPCHFYIKEAKVFNKKAQGKKSDKNKTAVDYNHPTRMLNDPRGKIGIFNACNRRLHYTLDNTKYVYTLRAGAYTLRTFSSNDIIFGIDDRADLSNFFDHEDISPQDTPNILVEEPENNLDMGIEAKGVTYSTVSTSSFSITSKSSIVDFNVFVVNDYNRFILNKYTVIEDTKNLMRKVANIYKNTNIKVNLAGQLNIREQRNEINTLEEFRNVFEDIKNNNRLLRESHLIIFLKDKLVDKLEHDGSSYLSGAGTLGKNYSLVFLHKHNGITSTLINTRKIAHEIAHSMGVPHDGKLVDLYSKGEYSGYIMDTVDRHQGIKSSQPDNIKDPNSGEITLNNTKYLSFSDTSLFYIHKFYNRMQMSSHKVDTTMIAENEAEAIKMVNALRRMSYNQIVHNKLNSKEPDTIRTKYYLIISLVFYLASICIAIYYIK